MVEPGDWLVGDVDGVVAITAATLSICMDAAARRSAGEAAMINRLQAGSTTLELLGLDDSRIER